MNEIEIKAKIYDLLVERQKIEEALRKLSEQLSAIAGKERNEGS